MLCYQKNNLCLRGGQKKCIKYTPISFCNVSETTATNISTFVKNLQVVDPDFTFTYIYFSSISQFIQYTTQFNQIHCHMTPVYNSHMILKKG